MAKFFQVNAIKMRERLIKGYSFEPGADWMEEYVKLFEQYKLDYRIVEPEDPYKKYHYYEQCKYPYSFTKIYLHDVNRGKHCD